MPYRWNNNRLDNLLFQELIIEEHPSQKEIRNLVRMGANVNAVNGEGISLLKEAISSVHSKNVNEFNNDNSLDIRFIKLMIELGADVNYVLPGEFNCLYEAALTWRPELVELLLKNGANPNCYSTQECESLLSWVEFEQWYAKEEETGGAKLLGQISKLLKQYGGATEVLTTTGSKP